MARVLQPTHEGPHFDEAVARLSGIRQALALAEASGAGPASDFDTRSEQVADAASAGLNALAAVAGDSAASRELVERIRRELAEISTLALKA